MDQIVNIVVERLEAEGVDPGKIPACIESAINIIFCYPILSYQEFNKRMKSRGWLNFKIDEHTFKLVKLISNHTETTPALRSHDFGYKPDGVRAESRLSNKTSQI